MGRLRSGIALGAIVAILSSVVAPNVGARSVARTATRSAPLPRHGTIVVPLPNDPASCDPLGGERCLLPFPNDYFTVADSTTSTGRRVNFAAGALPANVAGQHIDPAEWNRNDGFSPGSAAAVLLPGIDLAASGAAPITDMGRSLARTAPIVIIDADTGKRHPYFAELDARAPDDAHRLTFIRPAKNFREGHRYIVAIRHVVDHAGTPIEPSAAFRAYRNNLDTGNPVLEARRPHMESIFSRLHNSGVGRRDLVLAWDFTIASERNLSERLLHMRDDAFASLGTAAPSFQITSVEPSTRANLWREVTGTFEVPNYLTGTGATGSVLNNGVGHGSSPLPHRNGTYTAKFICTIPSSAIRPDGTVNPTRLALYGHGLLGSAAEVRGAGSRYAAATNTTFCATWWIGMSEEDVGTVVSVLADMSQFRTLPDRLQQSILNTMFLGRLMKHSQGFASSPAFRSDRNKSVLDRRYLTMVGVSQGGIIGGAATAVAQDWNRAVLGVPAMNYSTLLDRSVDFDVFATVFDPNYPDWVDRQLTILLVQMLWDRGENNGYAQHLGQQTYRDTKCKEVLLFEAFGDHQVANVATEVMARTIGAELRAPGLNAGRSPDVTPFWGIRHSGPLPDSTGSYLVMWDFGTPAPPTANVPNRAGSDPHGMGRDDPRVLAMTTTFLNQSKLIDVCNGAACTTP